MVHDSNRVRRKATWKDDDSDDENNGEGVEDDNDEDNDDNDGDHDDNEDDDANSVDEDDDANSVDEDENRRDKNFNVEVSFDHKVLVKIRAGVFYRTAGILAGLNSSSFCELIDKVIFKINLV